MSVQLPLLPWPAAVAADAFDRVFPTTLATRRWASTTRLAPCRGGIDTIDGGQLRRQCSPSASQAEVCRWN